MNKKVLTFLMATSLALMCGCKTTSCKNGPVAPENQSYEYGESSDPSLPFMIPWWKQN